MLATEGVILTTAGSLLISRSLELIEPIEFTHMKIGTGDISSIAQARKLNDLVANYKNINMSTLVRSGDLIRVRGSFTNEEITEAVKIKEIGVFAKIGTEQPILFGYINDGEGELIPPGISENIIERIRDLYIGITGEAKVAITINKSLVYATIEDLEEGLNRKEDKFIKRSGWNLDKTDLTENDSNKVFTPKGALNLFNTLTTNFTNGINAVKEVLRLDIVKKLNKGAYSGDAQDLKNEIDTKEPIIEKRTGFNLDKTDLIENDNNMILTSKGAFDLKTSLENLITNLKNTLTRHVGSLVSTVQHGHMSKEDKIKLDNIDDNANNYSLPVASGRTLGGVKIGNNLSVSGDGTISGLGRYIHPIETGFYHIPAGGGNNQFIKWESDGIGTWDFIDWDFIQNNPINPNWRYCCSLRHPETATSGYTITTNIPFDANGMYHVRIEGYAYGSAMPIMIDLVFYIYPPDSTTFVNCRYHYYGYDPGQIILFHNNNNIRVFIQNNIYYISLNVYATVETLGDKNYLNGWSMVENGEQPSGVSVAVLKRKIYTEDDKPTIQEIGAMPLLGNRNADFNLNNRLSQTELLQEYTGTMNFSDIINGFPMVNNANGILTFNTHNGSYGHQVGFSSNGKMYHRASSAGTWNDWSEFIKRGKSDLLWSGAHYMDSREVLSLTNIDFNDYQAICLYVSCEPSPAVDSNLAGQMLCPTAEYGAVSYSWLDLTGRDWCGAYLINNYQIQPYAGAGVWILRVVGMR